MKFLELSAVGLVSINNGISICAFKTDEFIGFTGKSHDFIEIAIRVKFLIIYTAFHHDFSRFDWDLCSFNENGTEIDWK